MLSTGSIIISVIETWLRRAKQFPKILAWPSEYGRWKSTTVLITRSWNIFSRTFVMHYAAPRTFAGLNSTFRADMHGYSKDVWGSSSSNPSLVISIRRKAFYSFFQTKRSSKTSRSSILYRISTSSSPPFPSPS